jgi:hypothetical protein
MILGYKVTHNKNTIPNWNNVVEICRWDVLSMTLIIQID